MAIRSVTSAQIIIEYGTEQGIEANELLKGSGLKLAQLHDHQMQIQDAQELKILENLLHLTQDPFQTGIELGSRYHLTSYGIMGYALLSSNTIAKAIELGLRYLGLTYAYSDIFLMNNENDVALGFSIDIPGDLGLMVLMRDIWAVGVIQRELFNDPDLPMHLRLCTAQPENTSLSELEAKLGAYIQFDAESNSYVGLEKIIDLPLLKANKNTVKICEEQCIQLLQDKQTWKPVAKQVKDNLVHLGLPVSMEEIAKYMARTSRTLHRQLKQEGTTWRQVRDDVRMGIAEELLLKPLRLDEIAERLGFSDSANFSHGFKRCKGMTPSQYRKQNLCQSDLTQPVQT